MKDTLDKGQDKRDEKKKDLGSRPLTEQNQPSFSAHDARTKSKNDAEKEAMALDFSHAQKRAARRALRQKNAVGDEMQADKADSSPKPQPEETDKRWARHISGSDAMDHDRRMRFLSMPRGVGAAKHYDQENAHKTDVLPTPAQAQDADKASEGFVRKHDDKNKESSASSANTRGTVETKAETKAEANAKAADKNRGTDKENTANRENASSSAQKYGGSRKSSGISSGIKANQNTASAAMSAFVDSPACTQIQALGETIEKINHALTRDLKETASLVSGKKGADNANAEENFEENDAASAPKHDETCHANAASLQPSSIKSDRQDAVNIGSEIKESAIGTASIQKSEIENASPNASALRLPDNVEVQADTSACRHVNWRVSISASSAISEDPSNGLSKTRRYFLKRSAADLSKDSKHLRAILMRILRRSLKICSIFG